MNDPVDARLAEQVAYYRARAAEYDDWWLRRGRYDRGAEAYAAWQAEVDALQRFVDDRELHGDVLELACGTGLWTERLVRRARHVTAVDAAPEVLALNRERVGGANVDWVEADLFAWRPERRYDACFFGFWLSHVPRSRFAGFWELVRDALRPGGQVVFVDSDRSAASAARDDRLPGDEEEERAPRRLDDGREFHIVKRFWEPATLERELAALGFDVQVGRTGELFVHGAGKPARSGS